MRKRSHGSRKKGYDLRGCKYLDGDVIAWLGNTAQLCLSVAVNNQHGLLGEDDLCVAFVPPGQVLVRAPAVPFDEDQLDLAHLRTVDLLRTATENVLHFRQALLLDVLGHVVDHLAVRVSFLKKHNEGEKKY